MAGDRGFDPFESARTPLHDSALPILDFLVTSHFFVKAMHEGKSSRMGRVSDFYQRMSHVASKGEIAPFLAGGTTIFGSITGLLDEQWARLSSLEQTLLSWLAILREPVSIAKLLAVLVARLEHVQVLEAVDGLRRRSLVERGQRAGSFTFLEEWTVKPEGEKSELSTTERYSPEKGKPYK